MSVDSGALLALLVIGAVALGLLTRRRVTGVPLRMSLTRPGATRLHRRLHHDVAGASRAVRRARDQGLPVHIPADVLDDTRRRARELDARIVAASRLPFTARQRELLMLRAEVAELRGVAARVEQVANELVTPPAPAPAVHELHGRLDLLDAGRRDAHAVARRWARRPLDHRCVTDRRRVASGSPFEAIIGFSRAVRVGDRVIVSGTAPVWPDGSCDQDPEAQARRCFEIIVDALREAGAGPEHVVRTRMFITRPAFAEPVGRAHADCLGDVRPAATMVVISQLLDPRWKVEIEAEAVIE